MAVDSPRPAPWESVPAHEQLFVLVTGANRQVAPFDAGTLARFKQKAKANWPPSIHLRLWKLTRPFLAANSGVGLGFAQRLIDDFLATRSLEAHLVILATTRSVGKPRRPCSGPAPSLRGVRVPRLDSVVFNAAYGGWEGCNYPMAVWSILRKGLVQSVTWPDFKNALPTRILNEQQSYGYPEKPLLGEVFAACVFGHYLLAHELLPLLGRRASSPLAPSRIVWSSSLEAVADVFSIDDLQGLTRANSYESAKRLTDVLALTSGLPAARPFSSRWLDADRAVAPDGGETAGEKAEAPEAGAGAVVPPRVYLSHPGIVASTLFPVPWFLFWAYELALVVSRWLGSPWHCVDGYTGAAAAVWLSLQSQILLDEAHADRVKWGSSADRHGRVDVKKTEVEGWGWEGRPEDAQAFAADTAVGVLRKSIGRKYGVVDVTAEDIIRFEELGAACWKEMEELRSTWDDIIDDNDTPSSISNGKLDE
ncbi:hypothetical protein HIM_10188 [Hirsutella minnesotensis 3608]|uniref:3-keto-steroid reductase n=1 Tax=Hirsutella minnesotensis 3608 TaxID=1043627 RepID=A0A0F7ZKC5_9HYPO|nr:hypothetical protein HIM_10188 [Hirsutella minnesotensis 3608]